VIRSTSLALASALLLAALPLAAQQSGTLKVNVNPGRAGVFVDGKYVGPAKNFGMTRTYTVAAGDHEIRMVDPRYEEAVTKVTVSAGKKTEVTETLKPVPLAKPPFGVLRTESADKFTAVYINGKFFGHAGEFNNSVQGLLLPPGEYEVRLEPFSGAPVSQKVKIEANKTVIVK
jgi:hypothetical protein